MPSPCLEEEGQGSRPKRVTQAGTQLASLWKGHPLAPPPVLGSIAQLEVGLCGGVTKHRVGGGGLQQTTRSIHPIPGPILPQVLPPDRALDLGLHVRHRPTQGRQGPRAPRGLDSCSC